MEIEKEQIYRFLIFGIILILMGLIIPGGSFIPGTTTPGGNVSINGTVDHASLENLSWSVTNHTIDANVNFNSSSIINISQINGVNWSYNSTSKQLVLS